MTTQQHFGRSAVAAAASLPVYDIKPLPPLTAAELGTLADCERVIERGLKTFEEVGDAFLEIRHKQLYRQEFKSFEAYCRERWQIGARRGRQIADAAEVVRLITTEAAQNGTAVPLPMGERQARPLTKLPPDQVPEVWKEAVESAPNGKPTHRDVERAVKKRIEPSADRELEFSQKETKGTKERKREYVVSAQLFEEKIEVANSCTQLMDDPARILEPFEYDGTLWTVGATITGGDEPGLAEAYELIPEKEYDGPGTEEFSYRGHTVIWRKARFRLGPETIFRVEAVEKAVDVKTENTARAIFYVYQPAALPNRPQLWEDVTPEVRRGFLAVAEWHLEVVRSATGADAKREEKLIGKAQAKTAGGISRRRGDTEAERNGRAHAKTPRRQEGKAEARDQGAAASGRKVAAEKFLVVRPDRVNGDRYWAGGHAWTVIPAKAKWFKHPITAREAKPGDAVIALSVAMRDYLRRGKR